MRWMLTIEWILCSLALWLQKVRLFVFGHAPKRYSRARINAHIESGRVVRYSKKPAWVVNEVIRLKATLPKASGYRIAHTFNRIHGKRTSVSKSYVYSLFIKHQYEIETARRKLKRRPPYSYQKNQLWQIDFTVVNGKRLFGVIDCASRACLALQTGPNKRAMTTLILLLKLINRYGKPSAIRSDNDACLNSFLFKQVLSFINIQKQTTQIASPWQNGRIERLFGTLKRHAKQVSINVTDTQKALTGFQFWYNSIRPHQALGGLTPAEAWNNRTPNQSGKARYVSFWGGELDGFYVPPD